MAESGQQEVPPPVTDYTGWTKQQLIDRDNELKQQMLELDPMAPDFQQDIAILSGQRQSIARLLWHWDRDHPEG